MFSNILLQLIVFFLPTQLGLHFWPSFSRAAGIKVDYLSPTLYFTDILLVLFILVNIPQTYRWLRRYFKFAIFYLLFVSFNLIVSISPLNSLFWWLRLTFYLLFFLTLRLRKVSWSQIKHPLLVSTLLVILLEAIQFIRQASLGGPFYWLGERAYSFSTPGLARLDFFGRQFLRPMSTFSHPNSLAGYLLIVYFLFSLHKTALFHKLAIFFGLLLTFSKSVLLAFLLVIILKIDSTLLIYLFLFISLIQLIISPTFSSWQFVTDRLFLLEPTHKMILEHPLGVGLGSFIPKLANLLPPSFLLPSKLQPVHNTFLLIITELGLPGLTAIYFLIKANLKKIFKPSILTLLALVIVTAAFDHYWWTLPQNKLILLLALALLL